MDSLKKEIYDIVKCYEQTCKNGVSFKKEDIISLFQQLLKDFGISAMINTRHIPSPAKDRRSSISSRRKECRDFHQKYDPNYDPANFPKKKK